MARWTENVFSFGSVVPNSQAIDDLARETVVQETEPPNTGFAFLQEADAYGTTEAHEPGWLPEGYALDGLDVLTVDNPSLQTFSASYTDGERRVSVNIISYEGKPSMQV